ncbi:putative nicotinamide N-methyltransferase Nnt1 [Diplocarpon rosae]|nr:putative nicotinamide N-methyltransferase Nnt1 [Diplocarpon rosae]
MTAMAAHQEDDDVNTGGLDLFAEPADYYPPTPTPTTETHTLLSGRTLTVSLVGHNPLWGHHLWNAGRLISTYLEKNPSLISSKTVLELGAGAGLPSLVCAVLGASKIVVTDYPDADLVANLQKNVDAYYAAGDESVGERGLVAEGYCWGADVAHLLAHAAPSSSSSSSSSSTLPGFDVLILADLLFNHSEHSKLVSTIELTLQRSTAAKALVFFTPYRPWLLGKDMAFFDLARERGFSVEKVLEEKMERVMFLEDRGDEEVRRTVFGFVLRWKL